MHPQPVFSSPIELPLSAVRVTAGFPSPAEDYIEAPLDLAKLLVGNAAATFLWRVAGWCMQDAGIHDADILIVDRSLEPVDGDVVVAVVEGEVAVKRFRRPSSGAPSLANDNARLPPFTLAAEAAWEVWGVVTWNLRAPGPARCKR